MTRVIKVDAFKLRPQCGATGFVLHQTVGTGYSIELQRVTQDDGRATDVTFIKSRKCVREISESRCACNAAHSGDVQIPAGDDMAS
jgi:hypothetical protein